MFITMIWARILRVEEIPADMQDKAEEYQQEASREAVAEQDDELMEKYFGPGRELHH